MTYRSRALRFGAGLLILALGVTGCGSSPKEAGEARATESATTSAKPENRIPEELQFTAQTVDGDPFQGASLAGKDAVLWFWAPWCSDCRREAPHVAAAQAAHADVTFVGVAGLGEVPAMQDFVRDYQVGDFVHLADMDGSVWQRFGVVQQPATAFIDSSGSVKVVRGSLGARKLEQHLARLTQN